MLILLQISNKNFVNYLNANTERNGLVYKYRFLLTLFFLTVPPRQKKKNIEDKIVHTEKNSKATLTLYFAMSQNGQIL